MVLTIKKTEKMKAFVKKNTWRTNFGWGNGYVAIPKGHALYGKDYDEIHELMPTLNVHGELTFSRNAQLLDWEEIPRGCKRSWIVGFDTCHFGDNQENWSKEAVMIEAEKLREQLEQF